MKKALEDSEEGDRIDVDVRRNADEAVISIVTSVKCAIVDDDLRIQRLAHLMSSLDGAHRVRAAESGGTVFELRVPAAPGRAITRET